MKRCIVTPFADEREAQAFVKECESEFENRMEAALKKLLNENSIRLLGLTGPTCSGKTTAAKKMTSYLESTGFRVHVISLDDFYYDKEYLKKRADNATEIKIDYDSEETIDIELLEKTAERLFSNQETVLPHFNFHTGRRTEGARILPQKEDVFLFEGIQLLYPKVDAILEQTPFYQCVFICPQSSIAVGGELFEPNEIRFCRRLVRDARYRSASPDFTFYLWSSVRQNEEKSIFPNVHLCHTDIDSTMPYEIGMLKPYLEPLLKQIPKDSPYSADAEKILKKINLVQPISADYIGVTSLYKEFI